MFETPSTAAYAFGTQEMVDMLNQKGVIMPLWAACKWGNLKRIQELIDGGVDINKKIDGIDDYSLTIAVKGNQLDAVKLILANRGKVNLDERSTSNDKPIKWAAVENNMEIMELLLKNGGDPNYGKINSIRDESPLYKALSNKNYAMAEILLKAGARTDGYDVMCMDDMSTRKITFFETFQKDREAIRLLKKYRK